MTQDEILKIRELTQRTVNVLNTITRNRVFYPIEKTKKDLVESRLAMEDALFTELDKNIEEIKSMR